MDLEKLRLTRERHILKRMLTDPPEVALAAGPTVRRLLSASSPADSHRQARSVPIQKYIDAVGSSAADGVCENREFGPRNGIRSCHLGMWRQLQDVQLSNQLVSLRDCEAYAHASGGADALIGHHPDCGERTDIDCPQLLGLTRRDNHAARRCPKCQFRTHNDLLSSFTQCALLLRSYRRTP